MIAGLTVQIKPRRRCYRRAVLARAAASSLRRLRPTQARDAVARTRLRRLSPPQYAAPGPSTGAPGAGAAHIQAPWASCCPRIVGLTSRRGFKPRQSIILADQRAGARGGLVFAKLSRICPAGKFREDCWCDAHALAHPSASPYEPADRLMDRSKANKFKGWGSAAAALRRCARRERSLSKLTAGWQRYIYTSINRCCNRATSSAANAAFQPIPRCAVVPHAPT